jgi:molecular chaperone DnaJ
LVIEYVEAYTGCDPKVKSPRVEKCETCEGTGARSKIAQACPRCQGQGQVVQNHGFIRMATTCPQCRGTGEFPSDPCPDCNGHGRVNRHREINIHVPAGVSTGARLRLKGEGGAGEMGGQPGDLYVDVIVKHQDVFGRERNHVLYETKIDMVLAALGGELEVPTVTGETRTVKVPEGAQNGKLIRIPGLGFRALGSSESRGDLIVSLSVSTPKNLTDRQREILEEFRAIEEEKSHENPLKGWTRKFTNKVKKVLQN